MNPLSIFDIYKIGVGPSSSHTLGPWKAANQFVNNIKGKPLTKIEVHLYGSLSKTGRGHATDYAVVLGLEGFEPETIDTKKINDYINHIKAKGEISINKQVISFNFNDDITFHTERITTHPNTLTFKAFQEKTLILEETYYSIGGGFIEKEGEEISKEKTIDIPFPIEKAQDLTDHFMSKILASLILYIKMNWFLEQKKKFKTKYIEYTIPCWNVFIMDVQLKALYLEGLMLNVKQKR